MLLTRASSSPATTDRSRTHGPLHGVVAGLVLAGSLVGGPAADAGTNEWTAEGPYGGNITALAIDPIIPSRIFAGTERTGVWQSIDGGGTWGLSSLGIGDTQILSLTTHPFEVGVVYAVSPGQVNRSEDFGGFWSSITSGLGGVTPSGPLAIDPQSGTDVYLGTQQGGVYKSTNRGSTWAPSNTGLPDAVVTSLAIDPADPSVVYAALENGLVWKSLDGGATWALASNGLTTSSVTQLALDPHQPSVLYAATPTGLFKTTNGAGVWNLVDVGSADPRMGAVVVDPRNPGVVYVGSLLGDGLFRSTDDGATWSLDTLGRETTSVSQIVVDPDGTGRVYLGDFRGGGIYRSVDGGLSWESSHQGVRATVVLDIAIDPSGNRVYAATTLDGVVRGTEDLGWEPLPASPRNGYCCDHVVIDPQQPQTLYAAGIDGVYRSPDEGASWERSSGGLLALQPINDLVIHPQGQGRLYAASFDGVYRTADGGDSWARVGATSLDEAVWSLALDPAEPTTLVAATLERLYRSTDGGGVWTPLSALPPGFFIDSIALDPNDNQTLYVSSLSGGVFKSTDGGATLAGVGSGQIPAGAGPLLVDPEDSSRVFVGTFEGVSWSADGGATWGPFEGGIRDTVRVGSLALRRDPVTTYFAGTVSDGVYSLTRGCDGGETVLCIDDEPGDRRFTVTLFLVFGAGSGDSRTIPLESLGINDGGIFYFFFRENPEMLVKIVDGCGFNDRFWVFAAATTTQGFFLEIEDTRTGEIRRYENPEDQPAITVADIDALGGCDAPPIDAAPEVLPTSRERDFLGLAGLDPQQRWEALSRQAPQPQDGFVLPTLQRRVEPQPVDVVARDHEEGGCVADATTLCIDDEPGDARFAVHLDYDSVLGGGQSGRAQATSLAALGVTDGGILSFFDPSNPEVLVKVLDGCGFNDHYWVFAAATTTLGFDLVVEDTHTGARVTYTNPDTQPATTVTDIEALATCGD